MPVHPSRYRRAERILEEELEHILLAYDAVAALDVDDEVRRWYLRIEATERDFVTIWLTLRERMLHHETYFMPAPAAPAPDLWRYLLRLNRRIVGARFALGEGDDVYLVGAIPLEWVDVDQIDRLIGTVYSTVEAHFRTAMRLGRVGSGLGGTTSLSTDDPQVFEE